MKPHRFGRIKRKYLKGARLNSGSEVRIGGQVRQDKHGDNLTERSKEADDRGRRQRQVREERMCS